MEINVSEMKRVQLFEVIGRVDSTNANELGAALDKLGRMGTPIWCSTWRRGLWQSGLREMGASSRCLLAEATCRQPFDRVKEVLELAADTIFEIYLTQVEAAGISNGQRFTADSAGLRILWAK
jgi:hypothetical protein